MIATTRRWVDSLVELTTLRLVVWFSIVVSSYPGILKNPYKLANWFDDHFLYATDEADRISLLKYHQLPQWNPYWCGGTAGIAEPEDSFYSPDFWLRLIFGSEHGRRLALLLFFVMGLEGTYRLCRRLDSTAVSAAFAAIVFSTCDRFLSFIHDGWVHFLSFQLVPWVILALINGIESLRWRVVGGMFLAWIVLAPGTYTTPYTAIAFAYWVVFLIGHRLAKNEPEPFRGPLVSALTIGGIGFLLCCCKLVPTVLFMSKFTRIFNPVETHSAIETLGALVPRYSLVVFFAVGAAVFGDVAGGACVGAALLFFLLAMGDYGPVSPFHLMKRIPLLGQLRFPDRFVLMVILFCSVASSRGLSKLEDAIPTLFGRLWAWARTKPALHRWLGKKEGQELPPEELPKAVRWIAVGLAALLAFKIAMPVAEELAVSQREGSNALFVEDPIHPLDQDFRQARGNRRDAHIFPDLNLGSLNCVLGIPAPESARLRGDLPQEEYPADPAVASVKRVSWSPNKIVLDVDAKSDTTIFVNQNWAPGWRASVGKVRSEDKLLAVDVPAGHNTVTLEYRDYVLYFAFLVSLSTLLTILWFGARIVIKRARELYASFDALPTFPDS